MRTLLARTSEGHIVNLMQFVHLRVAPNTDDGDTYTLWFYGGGLPTALVVGSEATCEEVKTKIVRLTIDDDSQMLELPALTADDGDDSESFVQGYDEMHDAYEKQVAELKKKLAAAEQVSESFQSAARSMEARLKEALETVESLRRSPDDNYTVTRDEYQNLALRSAELREEIREYSKIIGTLQTELRRAYAFTEKLTKERNAAVQATSGFRDELYRLKRKYAQTGEARPEDTII